MLRSARCRRSTSPGPISRDQRRGDGNVYRLDEVVLLHFRDGLPAISVPCGFTADGLPVGVQIVGRHQDEFGVLQLAHAFEQTTQTWKRRPLSEPRHGVGIWSESTSRFVQMRDEGSTVHPSSFINWKSGSCFEPILNAASHGKGPHGLCRTREAVRS